MAEFAKRTAAFQAWFRSQSGATLHGSVALHDLRTRGAGRGMVATADIPADTELFAVPRASLLSVENSEAADKLPDVFSAIADASLDTDEDEDDDADDEDEDAALDVLPSMWLGLIVAMVYEHVRGDASRWKPYLDVLPQTFDTPMFWSDAELAQLQASDARRRVGRRVADDMLRKHVVAHVVANEAAFYPDGADKLSEERLLALAHRMGSTIMAYGFDLDPEDDDDDDDDDDEFDGLLGDDDDDDDDIPDLVVAAASKAKAGAASKDKAANGAAEPKDLADELDDADDMWIETAQLPPTMGMVPMADMLNSDAEFNAHLNHEETQLVMRSIRPIAAGEEILNYYGPLPNSELLRRYGYTSPKHSRYDVVELPIQDVVDIFESTHENGAKIVEQVEEAGLDVSDSCLLEREAGHPDDEGKLSDEPESAEVPNELVEQVNLLCCLALGVSIEKWEAGELSEEQERKLHDEIVKILPQVLDKRIKRYTTSIAEDEETLKKLKPGENVRLEHAIRVRLGEKKLLQEARENLSNLDLTTLNSKNEDDGSDSEAPSPKRRKVAE